MIYWQHILHHTTWLKTEQRKKSGNLMHREMHCLCQLTMMAKAPIARDVYACTWTVGYGQAGSPPCALIQQTYVHFKSHLTENKSIRGRICRTDRLQILPWSMLMLADGKPARVGSINSCPSISHGWSLFLIVQGLRACLAAAALDATHRRESS
jgi:hypothetical protein